MTERIAGHLFHHGRCDCGIHWADIRNADDAALAQLHFAHIGTLNEGELAQIRAARQAEDDRIINAMELAHT